MEPQLHIVFDGPPGPQSGRFVEVETPFGHGVGAGEWRERPDGYWVLVLTADDFPTQEEADAEAFDNGPFGVGA